MLCLLTKGALLDLGLGGRRQLSGVISASVLFGSHPLTLTSAASFLPPPFRIRLFCARSPSRSCPKPQPPQMAEGEIYTFGPYKIHHTEVFHSTPYSYAMVNLRPVVPGTRSLDYKSLRVSLEFGSFRTLGYPYSKGFIFPSLNQCGVFDASLNQFWVPMILFMVLKVDTFLWFLFIGCSSIHLIRHTFVKSDFVCIFCNLKNYRS